MEKDNELSQEAKERIKKNIDEDIVRYEEQLSQLTEDEKEILKREIRRKWEQEQCK